MCEPLYAFDRDAFVNNMCDSVIRRTKSPRIDQPNHTFCCWWMEKFRVISNWGESTRVSWGIKDLLYPAFVAANPHWP